MRENDDLDLLLDTALKTYAESETSPSLEQRILARIAAEPSAAPRPRWLPWAIALPLAACLLLFVLFMSQQHRAPNQNALVPSAPSSPLATLPAAPHPARVRSARARPPLLFAPPVLLADRNVPLPKLDVFPTPQPLTAEERTLAAIASETPVPLRIALIEAQSEPDAPLHIAEISIPPIEPHNQVQP
jgi:hypothetical protein